MHYQFPSIPYEILPLSAFTVTRRTHESKSDDLEKRAHKDIGNYRSAKSVKVTQENKISYLMDCSPIPLPTNMKELVWVKYERKGMPVSENTKVLVRDKNGNVGVVCKVSSINWGSLSKYRGDIEYAIVD